MPARGRYISTLEARIAALESRILNFEYARQRLTTLLENADAAEVPQYEQAIAKNRATVVSLGRQLSELREKLAARIGQVSDANAIA